MAKINRNIFQKNVQNAALFVLSDILIIISYDLQLLTSIMLHKMRII
jgi:hypothetical protein